MENNEEAPKERRLSNFIDYLFSRSTKVYYLVGIFLLGFILRLVAAINLSVTADDMHHVTHAVNFLSAGRLITYDQSAGLWHSLVSVLYNIFGLTQLSSRFPALIFGSLSILVIYLLSKEFFSEKVALISAFLLAVAPFHIKNTFAEMDVMAMFFVLVAMLFFIRGMKSNRKVPYALSGIFMGLAIYTKVYPLFFIPSLLLYFAYVKRREKHRIFSKRNIKLTLIFLIAAFIFTVPALTHNYLLYKDKGFMDLHFSRTFIPDSEIAAQYYSWDPIWGRTNSWSGLIYGDTDHGPEGYPLILYAGSFVFDGDPVNFILGFLGLFLILFSRKNKKDYIAFFILSILFIYPFLVSIILLSKHILFLEILLIPMGAFFLVEVSRKIKEKTNKKVGKLIIILIMLSSLILLGMTQTGVTHFYGKSNIGQAIDFKNEEIPQSSLIVVDSRMYRGRVNWISQGRPYLEGSQFIEVLNQQDQISGNVVSIDVYYFECIPNDCGWGTVKNQPEFNASMEALTDLFKQEGRLLKTISEPNRKENYYPLFKNDKEEYLNVYVANLQLKESIIPFASQPKAWFLYNIGYLPKSSQFDYYTTSGAFDALLNKLAHLIVKIALALAVLSPLFIIYITYKSKRKKSTFNPDENTIYSNTSVQ